jgi:hypothetical protein
MYQIVDVYMHGQILMNANCNRLHQREILKYDPVPDLLGDLSMP